MLHLSRIDIFVEVAKEESFAAAARNLGLTSSAVSKQVQNLEQDLKIKLFNRTTRRVALTEEGAIYFERAARALDELREAEDFIQDMTARPRGTLKISIPIDFGLKYLATTISCFAKKYPDITLDITMDDRLVDVVAESFDMVVRIGVLEDSTLMARKLATCPFVVSASPEYLSKYDAPKKPDDLKDHNVLAYTRNTAAHEWRYKGPDGIEKVVALKSTFKCDTGEMMHQAVKNGIGIAILPMFFVNESLQEGKLIPLLEEYSPATERNIYAVFPPNRYQTARLKLFLEEISAICKKLPWEQ